MTKKIMTMKTNIKKRNFIKVLMFSLCCLISFAIGINYEMDYQLQGTSSLNKIENVLGEDLLNKSNLPLYKMKIIVDAGHGGLDSGTIEPRTGVKESELSLQIVYKLKNKLEQMGAKVILTRTIKSSEKLGNTKKMSMEERGLIIEKANADMFVSIHQNYNEQDSTIRGAQVLVRKENTTPFASKLQDALNSELNADLNYINSNYAVLSYGNQPGVIIECGFFSNQEELQLLMTEAYQERLINIYTQQLEDYWKKKQSKTAV